MEPAHIWLMTFTILFLGIAFSLYLRHKENMTAMQLGYIQKYDPIAQETIWVKEDTKPSDTPSSPPQ